MKVFATLYINDTQGGTVLKRIFVTGISQESNSFNPLKSTYDDFVITKGSKFREMPGPKTLIDAGYEVIESVWARAVPGGTLKFEDFMIIVSEMLEPLVNDVKGFDGVFLPLHGALDVEHVGSGEAYLVSIIREYVGPNVPISVALDMHANNMYTLAGSCNIIYGYRTAPHIDVIATHVRSAKLLIKAIEEDVLPRTRILRIPFMMPGENFMTSSGLGKEVIDMLPSIEEAKGVWCSSYFVGMAWVDCPQNGAAIVISGLGNMDEGMEKAEAIARFIWDNHDRFGYQGYAVEPLEGIEFVKKHHGNGLVIISDSADNITAGGAGDNAYVLDLFLHNGIQKALFACIVDPIAVEKCLKYKVGDVLDIEIGGAFDTNSTKVLLPGTTIKAATFVSSSTPSQLADDRPNSVVLSYHGIDILLFDKRKPVFSEVTLNENGLTLHDYEVIVVKQGYLEPEFNQIAAFQAMLYTTGNVDQRLERLSYDKLRRPIYPVDPISTIPTHRRIEKS
jgi:microcystin degradation protein MlrC